MTRLRAAARRAWAEGARWFERHERLIGWLLIVALCAVTFWSTTEARRTHAALCVYKADLQRRAAAAAVYLQEHPEGAPQLGIEPAQLQADLANRVSAIRALDKLRCDPPQTPIVVTTTTPTVPPTTTG